MRRLRVIGVVLATLAATIACGGNSGDNSSPTASSVPTSTPSPLPSASEAPAPVTKTLIRNGLLIDGRGGEPVGDAWVLFSGERIESVGSGAAPPQPGGTHVEVLDAGGGVIMPGLVDAHVHIARSASAGSEDRLLPWTEAGFTTLRDVGVPPELFPAAKQSVDGLRAAHKAPYVVWAGPIVTQVGGYPVPVPAYAPVAREVASTEEARAVVAELADGGAGVIKLGLEQGYYSDLGWPLLDAATVGAIVEEARARGMRVTAHVTSIDELTLALDAGVDDVAHAPLEPIPDALLGRMVAEGVGIVTTATVWGGGGAPSRAAANVVRFAAAGGTVAIGTDFGCCDQVAGLAPYLGELEFLRQAGMDPLQLLTAATRNGAILAGRDGDTGTIDAGKLADVLVVRGNPVEDLRALAEPLLVVAAGHIAVNRLP